MKNLRIHISGKVYKVGFRYFVKQQAIRAGITGTVCYLDNNTLIIEASGNDEALNKFINFCRIGTIGSQIESITISNSPVTVFRSFEIVTEEEQNYNNHIAPSMSPPTGGDV